MKTEKAVNNTRDINFNLVNMKVFKIIIYAVSNGHEAKMLEFFFKEASVKVSIDD